MKSLSVVVLSFLLCLVAAAPVEKRAVVWVTATEEVVETVMQYQTVWVEPSASTAVASDFHHTHDHKHTHASPTSTPEAAPAATSTSVYVAPVETTPSSTYVAPVETSSTSVYVAPVETSSTSVYVAPSTTEEPTTAAATTAAATTAAAAAAATTSVAAASDSSTSAPSGETVYTGDITYYADGLGSCGWTSTPDQAIVAIPHGMMNNPANPNDNPLCGKTITISYAGETHVAKIVDTCMGCDGASIDLSTSLFAAVAPEGNGRVHGINWWYNP